MALTLFRLLYIRTGGFFIVGTRRTPGTTRLLTSYGHPVVETWDWNDSPTDALVGFSNRNALADMVRLLVRQGHRRMAFAGVITGRDERAQRRLEGFQDAVAELVPDEELPVVDLPGEPIAMDTGVDVPRRLAITGFGDFEMARHLRPAVTTVAVDSQQIGSRAADLLLARMLDQPITESCVDIGYRIEVRQSA